MICDLYGQAQELAAQGVYLVSLDEKTGIQALEHLHPKAPMAFGQPERREFEYIRHGTLALIASFDVATGTILPPSIGPTRTEEDLAEHVEACLSTDPDASWIFIMDQLNTHKSEALVRLFAKHMGLQQDLGVKGRRGILMTMQTRMDFLSNPSHRLRIVYTPKHCSWLNQIEIWFSILARRVLRRGSFASLDQLEHKLRHFIAYFNHCLAKPFKWTYRGRPLQA